MKAKYVISILALVLLAALVIPMLRNPIPSAEPENQRRPISPDRKERHPKPELRFNPTDDEMKLMMASPVEFYGKVIDQDGNPMIGVEVGCSWPFMTSMDNLALTTSAPDGRFEVTGRKAITMSFGVRLPPGYRRTESTNQEFLFGEFPERIREYHRRQYGVPDAVHRADKSNPVIFMLRKIEGVDSLYHIERGRDDLPRDGSPRYYSFSINAGKALEQPTDHCVEFRLISEKDPKIPNDGKLFNWSLRIRVPGGGLQLLQAIKNVDSGDYDELQAPLNGYQEEIHFDFPKSLPNGWKSAIQREFFFFFPDKTYGRAIIHGSSEDVRIESFLNPTGSRNLLFDETKSLELRSSNTIRNLEK